jgi:hypothetical protein
VINKLLLSVYILSGILAYGHYWENSDIDWNEMNKPVVGLMVLSLNPLYWSTVAFEVDDD